MWGCPGGKVENDEPDALALMREIEEELGVRPWVAGPALFEGDFDPPVVSDNITVVHYRAGFSDQQRPVLAVEVGMEWFTAVEILNMMPSTMVPAIRRRKHELVTAMYGFQSSFTATIEGI